MNHKGASWVAWVSLVISVVALIMAWTAYNRTGEDLENMVQREVGEAVQAGRDTVTE